MAKQRAIIMKEGDDVATALEALTTGEVIEVNREGATCAVTLGQDIPFGHKFALHDIDAEAEILKYGLPIGRALEPILVGDWVHVHNCRSARFGFRHEEYGVNA